MRAGPDVFISGPVTLGANTSGYRRGRARGGIAPAHLLDVQTSFGDIYHWSDRDLKGIPGVIMTDAETAAGGANYSRWLSNVGRFSFNRSLQTDTGSLQVQNLSGDVLQSDFERIFRKATLQGALFVYRYYSVDLNYAWIEQHGTLTLGNTPKFGNASLSLVQITQGQDDTPEQIVSENCQLNWGEPRCGAKGNTECLYTYASCQVIERFVGIQSAFETNNPETVANLPQKTVNRARPW